MRALQGGAERRALALALAALMGGCLRYEGEPPEAGEVGSAPDVPALHHAHLNSVDPDAAIDFYLRLWPSGRRGEVAGHPAFVAELALLFDRVDAPPPGAWSPSLERSDPQSAFWHIGAFVNTTGLLERLAAEGIDVLPLWTSPDDEHGVARSGLTPYAGIVTLKALAGAEAAAPRDGGFGYVRGPDGALVELTGSPRTKASFSHVHLFHEQPRCAANWYVEHLGMSIPPRRDAETGDTIPVERWEDCASSPVGEAGWPSLEHGGTLRAPNGSVRFANGSVGFYPRQCRDGRCGAGDGPLVPSAGQVLDHVGFRVAAIDPWIARLRAQGVGILDGPYAFGDGRGVLIEGPDGLGIELIELP